MRRRQARPVVYRPPAWMSFVAPWRYLILVMAVSICLGILLMVLVGFPGWLGSPGGVIATTSAWPRANTRGARAPGSVGAAAMAGAAQGGLTCRLLEALDIGDSGAPSLYSAAYELDS